MTTPGTIKVELSRMSEDDPKKTVTLDLTKNDGSTFALLNAFFRQAKTEGWTRDEMDAVVKQATSGDYAHLKTTLANHCTPPPDDL